MSVADMSVAEKDDVREMEVVLLKVEHDERKMALESAIDEVSVYEPNMKDVERIDGAQPKMDEERVVRRTIVLAASRTRADALRCRPMPSGATTGVSWTSGFVSLGSSSIGPDTSVDTTPTSNVVSKKTRLTRLRKSKERLIPELVL
jgi:hypothetical protein